MSKKICRFVEKNKTAYSSMLAYDLVVFFALCCQDITPSVMLAHEYALIYSPR